MISYGQKLGLLALGAALIVPALMSASGGGAMAKPFVAAFKKVFGNRIGNDQVRGIEAICNAFAQKGDGDQRKLLFMLCVAWHESLLTPIREIKAAPGTVIWDQYQSKYWPAGYYGRGFVQLTLRGNYEKMSQVIGADLVNNPDLALRADYAAKIIVVGLMQGLFTGKKLGDYINQSGADYYNARKCVGNTTVAGKDIAQITLGHVQKIAAAMSNVA